MRSARKPAVGAVASAVALLLLTSACSNEKDTTKTPASSAAATPSAAASTAASSAAAAAPAATSSAAPEVAASSAAPVAEASSAAPVAESTTPVKITVAGLRPGAEKEANDALKKQAADFTAKYPHITVDLKEYNWTAPRSRPAPSRKRSRQPSSGSASSTWPS